MKEVTIQKVLMFLEEEGWSKLIDSRWERQMINDIKGAFPNVTSDVLESVLKLVIV